jgi:hypothetical protein
MVFMEDLPQPESAERDDGGENNDQDIRNGSAHYIPLTIPASGTTQLKQVRERVFQLHIPVNFRT